MHPECARLLADLDRAADLSGASGAELGSAPPAPLAGARRLTAGDSTPVDLSIVIPCHDDGEFLIEAVASAERSAPERAELLIVDDGSTAPRTLEILAVLRQLGYTVIVQANAGLAAARNRGIREARGRYLLPLDADNRLRPGFPAAAMAVLDAAPEVGVVYGDRQEFGCRSGRIVGPGVRSRPPAARQLHRRLLGPPPRGLGAVRRLRRHHAGDGLGGLGLWIGAAERGWRFHRLPEVTFDYRVRPGSMASGLLSAEVGEPLRLHMLDKHRDLYRRRLPRLLTAQHEASLVQAELAGVAGERDRLRAERDGVVAERDDLARRLEETERRLAVAQVAEEERGRLADERYRLYAELAAYRNRVERMEGTRAWRLREWVLGLRHRLRL